MSRRLVAVESAASAFSLCAEAMKNSKKQAVISRNSVLFTTVSQKGSPTTYLQLLQNRLAPDIIVRYFLLILVTLNLDSNELLNGLLPIF